MDSQNKRIGWKSFNCKNSEEKIVWTSKLLFASSSQNGLSDDICLYGKTQCVAIAAAAIVYSRISKDLSEWTKSTLDTILVEGNSFYISTMDRLVSIEGPDTKRKKFITSEDNFIGPSDLNRTGTLYGRKFALDFHAAFVAFFRSEYENARPLKIFNDFFNQHTSGIIIAAGIARALFAYNQKFYIFDSHPVMGTSKAALIEYSSIENLSCQFVSFVPYEIKSLEGSYFDLVPIDCSFLDFSTLVVHSNRHYSGKFLHSINNLF